MKANMARNVIIKLILTGFAAGLANGLLGAGGGIIIVFAISRILPDVSKNASEAFLMALCVMLPISVLSCFIYYARGHMSLDGIGIFIIPAVLGGVLGGFMLGRLKADIVKKLFAVLTVISGMILVVR